MSHHRSQTAETGHDQTYASNAISFSERERGRKVIARRLRTRQRGGLTEGVGILRATPNPPGGGKAWSAGLAGEGLSEVGEKEEAYATQAQEKMAAGDVGPPGRTVVADPKRSERPKKKIRKV